jgi:pimeloyl-ACP methyl ester carboxylesterase
MDGQGLSVTPATGLIAPLPAPPPLDEMPHHLRAPLAAFAGQPPPAPAWFANALAQAPDRGRVETPRGGLEVLTWGDVGKPGLLFVHGGFANADWWTWIAPFFAADFRVTAMSQPGMGGSDWRAAYNMETFVLDAQDVAHATGLHAGGVKPIYIGHSFGGAHVTLAAARAPEQMAAAILIDTGFRPPSPGVHEERLSKLQARRAAAGGKAPARIFPDLETAVSTFRLLPPQQIDNLYILDHIARTSVKPVTTDRGQGWTWKLDPEMAGKTDFAGRRAFFATKPDIRTPMAQLYGGRSPVTARGDEVGRTPFPAHGVTIEIPDSDHHVLIDQPLALVTALRGLLTAWPAGWLERRGGLV